VKVHYDEGVANHIGPEPCADTREGAGEASVGEHAGQPLSRENSAISGADAFGAAKGNMDRRVMRVPTQPGVVVDPGMHGSSLHGNREISGLAAFSSENTVRSGKARSRSR